MEQKKIKMIVMDVDGTLTDGKIYMGANGEMFKVFDSKDGYGIHNILQQSGIVPVIITGRISDIVTYRAQELGVAYLYQGVRDKAVCLQKVVADLCVPWDAVACIGDDLNDVPMMKLSIIKGCPSNAAPEVKEICNYVCQLPGGHGAVREFIEWLIRLNRE